MKVRPASSAATPASATISTALGRRPPEAGGGRGPPPQRGEIALAGVLAADARPAPAGGAPEVGPVPRVRPALLGGQGRARPGPAQQGARPRALRRLARRAD